jgi:hypothetical protein
VGDPPMDAPRPATCWCRKIGQGGAVKGVEAEFGQNVARQFFASL